jgi:hypothetical protein
MVLLVLFSLLLLLSVHPDGPVFVSAAEVEKTFYLDGDHSREAFWKNGPILPETDRYNRPNQASYFWRSNGRHPYAEFPSLDSLPMDSFSVAIWVKIETSAAGGVIWDMECKNCIDRCPASVRLVATKQGAHVFVIPVNKEGDEALCGLRAQRPRIVNTITRLLTNTWRHVAVVLDAKSGRFELYVDGKLDGFVEGAVKFDVLAARTIGNFVVGRQVFQGSGAMPAAYDDLRVWNYPVSKSTIENLAKVDCQASEWTSWGKCTVNSPKSYAEKTRTRTIVLQPMNGGKACPTVLHETEKCDLRINL